MASILNEIAWAEPILPQVPDPAWEAEVKRRTGMFSETDRRVTPSVWVREACAAVVAFRPSAMPQRLLNIGTMVIAQENSCRYCYGANRAFMRILGYPESFISQIEQDAQVAELDPRDRGFIAFCRNLARSRPRPARAEREALAALGFAPLAISEMALVISMSCFYNRVSTMIASPPEASIEQMASGFVGKLMNLMGPLMRGMMTRPRTPVQPPLEPAALARGPFGAVLAPLAGLPGATSFRAALDGAFASTVLSTATKALMFAVVARTLDCHRSEAEARKLLVAEGFSDVEIDTALSTLHSARLTPQDSKLLSWVRGTVYYQPGPLQKETRALVAETGNDATLEAIGIAALANAVVRLAMLMK